MSQSMFDAEGKVPVMKPKNCYSGAAFQRLEVFQRQTSGQFPFTQNH